MRHLFGFVLALALSAALYFGGGWGISKVSAIGKGSGLETIHALTSTRNLLPIAALAGTGLFLGIVLVMRRISPLAAGLPGLVLIGWSGLAVLRGASYALVYVPDPHSSFAAGFSSMLSSGALALVGLAMVVPLFAVRRWRSAETEIVLDDDDLGDDRLSVNEALGLAP